MNKPTIVLDCDGVILNFSKSFADYHNNKSLIKINENPHTWTFDINQDYEKILYESMSIFIEVGYELDLLDDDWISFSDYLYNKYIVIIVTAYENQESRINNLKKYNIRYHQIIFSKNKIDIIRNIKPLFIFEDCPKNIIELLNIFPKTKIFVPKIWNYVKMIDGENIIKYDILENIKDLI